LHLLVLKLNKEIIMLTGFYAGVSGIHFNEEKLNVISNNLSNAETSGFRRSVMMMQTRDSAPKTSWVDSRVRSRLPSFYGVMREEVLTTKDGGTSKKHTGNSFDVAIDPSLSNAFFKVRALGSDKTSYTRNGTLSLGLENPADTGSQTVLYMAGSLLLDDSGNPIAIDSSAGKPQISGGGQIVQDGKSIGELGLYRFNKYANPDQLVNSDIELLNKLGGSLYSVPKGLEEEFFPIKIQLGKSGAGSSLMSQGYSESSNVNVVTELGSMMETEKSTKANQLAANVHMDGLQKLFQLIRNG
jgi:flagellar basal body rod protein FlgG